MVKSDVSGSVAGVASEVLNTGVLNMSASMNRLEEYVWNCAVSEYRVSGMPNRVWVELWSRVGGSMVGDGTSDPEDLKCRQFWKFEIFGFFCGWNLSRRYPVG